MFMTLCHDDDDQDHQDLVAGVSVCATVAAGGGGKVGGSLNDFFVIISLLNMMITSSPSPMASRHYHNCQICLHKHNLNPHLSYAGLEAL